MIVVGCWLLVGCGCVAGAKVCHVPCQDLSLPHNDNNIMHKTATAATTPTEMTAEMAAELTAEMTAAMAAAMTVAI